VRRVCLLSIVALAGCVGSAELTNNPPPGDPTPIGEPAHPRARPTLIDAVQPSSDPPVDGGAPAPTLVPIPPLLYANNVIDLSALGAPLTGQSLSFTAGTAGTSLELSEITLHSATTVGLHVVHPRWALWDGARSTPDPMDTFATLDETVLPNDAKSMGPGAVTLPEFTDGMLIGVTFEVIEPKNKTP
jgi:hypothetical protein